MTRSLMLVCEGQGDVAALPALVQRTLASLGHTGAFATDLPRRINIFSPGQLEVACEYARSVAPDALLLTGDSEDHCPSADAPAMAARVRSLGLPFPVAVVLFHREYETLFVSVADHLAGRSLVLPGGASLTLTAGVQAPSDPEVRRDAKGWVGELLMGGTRYKPTAHQLPMTRAVQPADLRAAGLSSYRRLERALEHLVRWSSPSVYP